MKHFPEKATVNNAPKVLNLNDQAMWAIGWNECRDAVLALSKTASPLLDNEWRNRLLDGRELTERDECGFVAHPELPTTDEDTNNALLFAALGIELKSTSADDDVEWEELEAMGEASNWSAWVPAPPKGDDWKLVSTFDTEDGPAAWWMREAPVNKAALDAREIAGLKASIAHLSHLADHQATIAKRAIAAMKVVQDATGPYDESNGDFDARVPYAAYAAFVDKYVQLAGALRTIPAAAPLAGAVVAYRVLRTTAHGVWTDGGTGWQDGPPSSDLIDSLSEYPTQWRIEYAHAAPQGHKCANHAKSKREGQEAAVAAMPLCWVPEDELPKSMPAEAYSALFPHSHVDFIRLFPIFGVAPATSATPENALDAARMDYLHSTGSTVELLPGEATFHPMRFRIGGLHTATNLRVAIDAAIAAQAAQKNGGV